MKKTAILLITCPDQRGLVATIADFVFRHGGNILHPRRSLDDLVRVAALLADWGADQDLQVAGLCHACYGTDGYPDALLRLDERPVLTALAGVRAESLVYLYGSCDRAAVYPALGKAGPVLFRDRFTGRTHTPPERDIRAITELTAANELDVMQHNTALAAQHGAALRQLFAAACPRLTDAAWRAWSHQPGTDPAARPGRLPSVARTRCRCPLTRGPAQD